MVGISTVETQSIRKDAGIEGNLEFGQKNISTLQRNLLNKDEVLRIPSTKLLAILRGNNPLLLDKMLYTEHPLAEKLKDSTIFEYNPNWVKNITDKKVIKEENFESSPKKKKLDWETF